MGNGEAPLRVLEGLRVIELGEMVAGPFAGTLLAEFGAEVIKVERPGPGDVMRGFGPSVDGKSLYWLAHSAGKKSIILDLACAEGLEVLRELLTKADVLVDSLRPGTLEQWQLTDSQLQELNPQLVTVHVSGFGASGPYKDKAGYDPVAQGFSGLSYLTGDRDGAPMRAGGAIPVCDFSSGLLGAFGAVLSIYARDVRGSAGQTVDIALYDFAFRMIAPLLSYYELTGNAWDRDGNHSLGGAPTGHFRTQDGHWICVSVQTDQQFGRLAKLIDRPDWLTDQQYSSLTQRTQHRDTIVRGFAAWVSEHGRTTVIDLLEGEGLAVGTIQSVDELAADPHLAQRSTELHEEPGLGPVRSAVGVPQLSATPAQRTVGAPALGEHTAEILTDVLGYSVERLRELVEHNVVPDEILLAVRAADVELKV